MSRMTALVAAAIAAVVVAFQVWKVLTEEPNSGAIHRSHEHW